MPDSKEFAHKIESIFNLNSKIKSTYMFGLMDHPFGGYEGIYPCKSKIQIWICMEETRC